MSAIFISIIKVLIILLFLTLPLVHARFFGTFNIDISFIVIGKYEFTKVIFFNIISSIIIILYGLSVLLFSYKTSHISWKIIIILGIFSLTSLNSISPYISFFGSTTKGHGFLMYSNLIGLGYVLYNIIDIKLFQKINSSLIISSLGVAIIGIKEFFFPSFNYGNLDNRLLSTMGHPNYVSLYFLLIIPYLKEKLDKKISIITIIYSIVLCIILISLFLTKSIFALAIYLGYISYIIGKKYISISYQLIYKVFLFLIVLIFGILVFLWYPEKLHSFISRFFIWSTTLNIIFSDIRYFFLGIGAENLIQLFDSIKSPYLYLVENIGFTADRPHNIFLQYFSFFGVGGLLIITYFYYFIFKSFKQKQFYNYGLILSGIFLLLHFASIASYLIMMLYGVYILQNLHVNSLSGNSNKYINKNSLNGKFIIPVFMIFSVISLYFYPKLYVAEIHNYKKEYQTAIKIFPYNPNYYYKRGGDINKGLALEKIKTENYYLGRLLNSPKIIKNCETLTLHYPSVENYFYCGKITEVLGYKTISLTFYEKGVEKLPDIWNPESKYSQNILIQKFVDGKRFYSSRYSDLKNILKKLNK